MFVAAIRYADRLRDALLLQQDFEPVSERIPHGQREAHAVVDEWGWVRYGRSVLNVVVQLQVGLVWIIPAAVDRDDIVGRVGPISAIFIHEYPQIIWARVLLEEARNPE